MAEDVFCSLETYLETLGLDHARLEGIPTWMAMIGIIMILFVTHWVVDTRHGLPQGRRYWTWNLFRWRWLKALVKKPWFPLMAQSLSLFLFLLILAAGLIGNPNGNIGPVLTWTWWWALLIFLVLGFGQTFCMICPWEALSSLVTSWSLRSRRKKLGFEFPWPSWMRRIYPALILFLVLTWFELGRDVTHSPAWTAILAMGLMTLAILGALFFERRAFCRNACLVGRITGIYALFSPVELRPQSAQVCADCETKDCYRGNDHATGCPTGLFPGHLKENSYCTLCTECVRSCPHDNIGIQVRPPGMDLLHKTRFQWDEAWLAVVLLSLTSFHGFTMTPLWGHWNQVLRVETGLDSVWIFTVLMTLMVALSVLVFWLGAWLAAILTRPNQGPTHHPGLPVLGSWWVALKARGHGLLQRMGLMPATVMGSFPLDVSRSTAWNLSPDPGTGGSGILALTGAGGKVPAVTTGALFKAFAYSLVPIALFYHLAHNCMHFFLEAGQLIPLLSDPFGWGWNLFGTAGKTYGPLLSLSTIWWLQIICIVVGHVYGVVVADRVSRRLFADPRRRLLSLVPLLATMILFSLLSVWLIAQPMDMRTGM